MNPVTQSLLVRLEEPEIARFAAAWDDLEALVIRVYKRRLVTEAEQVEYARVRAWLRQNYPRWQAELDTFWRATTIQGAPLEMDPFLSLVSTRKADGFIDDWDAMQTLPAARQALNDYLVDQLEKKTGA